MNSQHGRQTTNARTLSMQTSQVSNAANVLTAPSTAGKQSDTQPASEPFGKVLSREVSERNASNNAPRQKEASDNASVQPPAKTSNSQPAEAKSGKESTAADEADATEDSANAAPAMSDEMLAFVANLTQIKSADGKSTEKTDLPAESKTDTDTSALPVVAATDVKVVDQAAASTAAKASLAPAPVGNADVAPKEPASRSTVTGAASRNTALSTKAEANTHAKADLPAGQPQALKSDEQSAQAATHSAIASAQDFASAVKDSLTVAANAMQPVQQAAVHAVQQQMGAAPNEKLTPRVGTPAWDQALGQKVVWMVAGEQQSASLTLNPPDLGPLQVVLNVSNSQANATFIAAQPEVRQALEAALPKLRDMLGEAGIQLGQASVNSGNPNQQGGFDQQASQRTHGRDPIGSRDSGADTPIRMTRVQPASSGQGLVDTFV
ncbi:hypothetical protein EGT07_15995 [Herbaspirillum sp. HC18]|nr:hypothetical protein EGT07_15995 [Herbaspirillum sp. HC18]